MSALDHLVTMPDGRVILDLGAVTYNVSPVEVLDANLASCLESHRDALLDVRAHLYPVGVSRG